MNSAADEPAAIEGAHAAAAQSAAAAEGNELAELLGELQRLEQLLPPAAREHLSRLVAPEQVTHATGIYPPERVTALFEGAPPECNESKEAAQARIVERLRFLRSTRLKQPKGRRPGSRDLRPFTPGEIAKGLKGVTVPRATVYYIFDEGRISGTETIAAIERFFGVLPGWSAYTEEEALTQFLRPIVRQLDVLDQIAGARARGVTKVAARSTEDLRGDPNAMRAIFSAFIAANKDGAD
ncbi:hypothetical protein ABZ016_13665 [Streptomyces sp. NPDC006372]|uniref:hypothetical protein n=1 Tax=Streptomyces sp. NPDC006372 TaxID=3155599 RepID=UPI0033BD9438